MIKRFLIIASLSISMILTFGALANDISVGVIDVQDVFRTSPDLAEANIRLEKHFSPQRDHIIKLTASLKENIEKFKRDEAVMDKKTTEELRSTIEKQQDQLHKVQEKFSEELSSEQRKVYASFMNRLNVALEKVAKKENLDLVLATGALLYDAKGSKDITKEVKNVMSNK